MKFPIYKQLDAMDCGPTCLRIVSKYYGKNYSLNYLREKSYTNKRGTSLLNISDAAENIGFRSQGVKITWEQLQNEVMYPCILHWNQRHFVVLFDIQKNKSLFKKKTQNKVEPEKIQYTFQTLHMDY